MADATHEQWTCAGCGELCQRRRVRGQRPKWCKRCRNNPRTTALCPICNKAVAYRATYCSPSCATQARAEQYLEQLEAQRLARLPHSQLEIYTGPPFQRQPRKQPRTRRSTRRFKSGQCRICGAWFISLGTDVTCSTECQQIHTRDQVLAAKGRRRSRKKFAYVADVHRRKVFEADGYRCHICKRKTDLTKAVPHPRAPTIDHVIPLARGGTHEPANCRTACFRCNATKSDAGGGEQFALVV